VTTPLPRVGIGFDVHRFAVGRRLVLGGVEIESDAGLLGHSDADVVLHAIMDALLGAAGLPDIGHHFPPSDLRFRDASSLLLLAQVGQLVAAAGWQVGNVDVAVQAEQPRLAPHVGAMRERIATALGLAPSAVGVKASTTERMGYVGRGEGIAAYAVALIVPTSDRGV
jgi:2-C-methyl-D-erythritol 2,4-cyclodiphosphate synthase